MASGLVLVLDILNSGEIGANFYFFCQDAVETGAGEERVRSVPSTGCAAPTIHTPRGLTVNGFNLSLITEAQRKLQSRLNIPLLPTLLRGHGQSRRAMTHSTPPAQPLSQLKIHSALPQPALRTPEHSLLSAHLIWDDLLCSF